MDEDKKDDVYDKEHYYVIPQGFLAKYFRNPLSEFLTVTDIGQFINAKHHYFTRPEGIDTTQIIYCYKGAGFYSIDGGDNRIISPGHLIILPSGKPHTYASTADNPWSVYWIHIKGHYFDSICKAWSLPQMIPVSNTYDKQIRTIFNQCFTILAAPYQVEEFFHLCQLAATFISLIPSAAKQSVKGLTSNGLKGVETAISYMRMRLRENVSLEDLAAVSGFSPSHLHHLFHTTSGYAPVEYFLRMKIQAAARDVIFSGLPIHSIAESYGIEDPYYFSRLFKRITGHSPTQYRMNSQINSIPPVPIQDWLASGDSFLKPSG